MALGLTLQLPEEDKHNYTRDYLEDQLAILLGGRIAEEITNGRMTTGAGNDIERVTDLARKMVCEWGMSDAMGPMTFGKKEEQIFLGREIAKSQDYSEATAVAIDSEVKRLVSESYNKAKAILVENKAALQRIADELMAREVLDADQVKRLAKGLPIGEAAPLPSTTPTIEEEAGKAAADRPAIVPSLGKTVHQE
jgi:cell division protease FtsH